MVKDNTPIKEAEAEKNAGSRFVSFGDDFTFLSSERSCLKCKHKTEGRNTCEAFPNRIPKDILRGGECKGDGTIRFEVIETQAETETTE